MEAMISQRVLIDVVNASCLANEKHGPLTIDPVRACAIMLREGGEAMNEALLMTSPKGAPQMEARMNLYTELSQVAATAMLIMTHIEEEIELGKADA